MLNPHNAGASTAENNISMAQTSVIFASWGSFGSFGAGMFGQTTAQASESGEQQSVRSVVLCTSRTRTNEPTGEDLCARYFNGRDQKGNI